MINFLNYVSINNETGFVVENSNPQSFADAINRLVIDNKIHNYYPDYFVELNNGECWVVEIKPYNQTQKPVNENCWAAKEYVKNMCKWKATKEFCDAKGYKFKVFTEHTINKI